MGDGANPNAFTTVDGKITADGSPNVKKMVEELQESAVPKLRGAEQFVDVTVTTAELLALFATPKELVAAPGAGRFLLFTGAFLFLDFNAAAYAGIAAGEDLQISYTNGAGQLVAQIETTGFLDAVADDHRWVPIISAAVLNDITPVANAALVLSLLVAEIITGDSPLLVRTFFRDMAVPGS